MNIGADYADISRFTAVIWSEGPQASNFPERPDEGTYDREDICVTGDVRVYRGIPQITVTEPDQLDTPPE